MDADIIIANLNKVQPFFQPIFSADEHRVAGYEVLGRFNTEGTYTSLGPFFEDDTIPEEYRIEVDNYLLEQSLIKMAASDGDFLIFVNRDPKLLMADHGERFMEIIKNCLKPEDYPRVVLELTDTDFGEMLEPLQHVLAYYRTYGIKVALSHLGVESHLDRIAQLSPQILKVNLEQLRISGGDFAQVILYSLSLLARKIGASLHFEQIERNYQLRYAWKNGGRYYQGFFLAIPGPDFIDENLMKEMFKQESQSFIVSEKKKLETIYLKTMEFNDGMQTFLQKQKKEISYEELLDFLAKKMDAMCFRLYICNEEGYQVSPNVLKQEGKWLVQQRYKGKNWSWRPYFLENIIKMKNEKKGILSDLYSDIETGETIRTFSYPLNASEYIFIDLSYAYLYENDELL